MHGTFTRTHTRTHTQTHTHTHTHELAHIQTQHKLVLSKHAY